MLSDDLNTLDQAISHPRMSKERGDDVYGAYSRLADAIHGIDALRAQLAAVEAEVKRLDAVQSDNAKLVTALAEATKKIDFWEHAATVKQGLLEMRQNDVLARDDKLAAAEKREAQARGIIEAVAKGPTMFWWQKPAEANALELQEQAQAYLAAATGDAPSAEDEIFTAEYTLNVTADTHISPKPTMLYPQHRDDRDEAPGTPVVVSTCTNCHAPTPSSELTPITVQGVVENWCTACESRYGDIVDERR